MLFSNKGLQVGDFNALQKQENSRRWRCAPLPQESSPREINNGIKPLFLQTQNGEAAH